MASKTSFYISEDKDFKGRLFFKLSPEGHSERFGTSAVTEFDSVASKDHVVSYKDAYKAFKKLNPEYILAWPELDVVIEPEVKVEVAKEILPETEKKSFRKVFARKKEEVKEPEVA